METIQNIKYAEITIVNESIYIMPIKLKFINNGEFTTLVLHKVRNIKLDYN